MAHYITVAIVICPHCGDRTEQEFLLAEFTCGNCDRPFKTHSEPLELVSSHLPLAKALTPRQIELLLWQIVMDFGGGEIGCTPADDVPGRELLVWAGENGALDLCANEESTDADS